MTFPTAAFPFWPRPSAAEGTGAHAAEDGHDEEGHVHLTQAERSSTVFVSALSVVLALAAAAALLIGTRWLRRRSAQRLPCPECGTYYRPGVDAVCPSCGHRVTTPPG